MKRVSFYDNMILFNFEEKYKLYSSNTLQKYNRKKILNNTKLTKPNAIFSV
jgi:hypothetical protein